MHHKVAGRRRAKLFAELGAVAVCIRRGCPMRRGHTPAADHAGRARRHAQGRCRGGDQEGRGRRHRAYRRPLRGLRTRRRRRPRRGARRRRQPHRRGGARFFPEHGGTSARRERRARVPHVHEISCPASAASADAVLEAAVEPGADDVVPTPTAISSLARSGAWARCRRSRPSSASGPPSRRCRSPCGRRR